MTDDRSLARKRAVLNYWTLVEFFSPYLLSPLLKSKQEVQHVFGKGLDREPLPWISREPLYEEAPESPYTRAYNLYLGLFNIEETADKARHTFYEPRSIWQSTDWKRCAASDSMTCFARLGVSAFGIPLMGTLSLSTLPWAHGRLLLAEENSLTLEQYWKSVHHLQHRLSEEFLPALPKRLVRRPRHAEGYLDLEALSRLCDLLFDWADYRPKDYPWLLIEPVLEKEGEATREPLTELPRDIPILNSFYLQDLEAASASLEFQGGAPIDRYLAEDRSDRVDIESDAGASALLDSLRPAYFPAGRWPENPSKRQSLMQQFAINQAALSSEDNPIISVNGPPGTGKTTLLREMVAHNLVARARALAKFKQAKEALTGRRVVAFGDGDTVWASDLDPSLLGYEMLVVSSNNLAVENLSGSLPLRSEIDESFGKVGYLEEVANKAFGGKGGPCWGLISAALGKRENCRRFLEQAFILESEEEGKERIWDWAEKAEGLTFSEARARFLELEETGTRLVDELDELAGLHERMRTTDIESDYERDSSTLADLEERLDSLKSELEELFDEEKRCLELLELLSQRVELWNRRQPSVWQRLKKDPSWQCWAEIADDYNNQRLEGIERLVENKKRQQEAQQQRTSLTKTLEDKELELIDSLCTFFLEERRYHRLREGYPDLTLPEGSHELVDEEVQKEGYYQIEELQKNRTELFIAAMQLHEAWLKEMLQVKDAFRGNLMTISYLLSGKTPTTAEDTRFAWQNVFMLIPVISSTFASVGRLFKYLEPGSIGWLFIDEAGQALPQAAVGAIWRASRVLAMGDPFQIEPICAIPHEVVDGMAKSVLEDFCLQWAPSRVSVQNLTDRATRFGTERFVGEEACWLGAPLRVHRRCLEPMFSIANEVAYDGSMVLATVTKDNPALEPSCWIDVSGVVSDLQYVPQQGEELLVRLAALLRKMPHPNVYVITPFREVADQLRRLVCGDKELKALFDERFSSQTLASWAHKSIGTTHTFQGKQAEVVFFVLGADRSTLGAVEWVCRKPNLVNVAVTRACHRLYVIGDYELWRRRPYVQVLAARLQRVCAIETTRLQKCSTMAVS